MEDTSELADLETAVHNILLQLPNLPAAEVPVGRTPEENVVVREGGKKPELAPGAKPHWDLVSQYGLIDFELGNKITGSGFPYIKTRGPNYNAH